MYVPDNYDQWAKHDAEQERMLDRLPVCDHCRKRIDDDYYWDIEGTLYCEKCLNKEFRREVVID